MLPNAVKGVDMGHSGTNSHETPSAQGNSRFWNPNALALGGKTALVCESIAFFLKKHLTFLANYGLIDVSCWQTFPALPLGNVSASHWKADKSTIHDTP